MNTGSEQPSVRRVAAVASSAMGSTALALCLGALATTEAEARITRIEIKRTEQAFEGKAYRKIAGIRMPDVAVPAATYTGWLSEPSPPALMMAARAQAR